MQDDTRLPPNDVISAISDAMAAAVKAHGGREAVMVMIVQPGEKNSYDQQASALQVLKKVTKHCSLVSLVLVHMSHSMISIRVGLC